MAFVFVQHLDPKHVSMLAQILGRASKMPVLEVRDGTRVQPNHVYVIPRNNSVSIENRTLKLGPRNIISGRVTSVDTFLQTLAEDQGARSIGVLLSGTGSDGTLGLKAIKAAGGITFVQNPQSAKYDGMPRNAVAAGYVDFIQTPSAIANELVRLAQHPYVEQADRAVHEVLPGPSDALNKILATVRSATGVDFAHYKPNTVRRRILRRMMLKRVDTIDSYLRMLRSDLAEVQALYNDILINVTEFFRDPEVFQALTTHVFPRITARSKGAARQVRIWVPGCSTGEEVYSLAIALVEYLGNKADQTDIQIFATDISEQALGCARRGIYPASIAQAVSPERLKRFFVKTESDYQIHKHIRELCVFARHNLAQDPPFSNLDFISCRNVLIYLDPTLQERVIAVFHYALNPGGFLLLGASEAISAHARAFQLIDAKHKVYSRKPANLRLALDFSANDAVAPKPEQLRKPESWTELDLQREADRLVLNKFGPPGVIVDDDMIVSQFRGRTSPFIEPAAGAASLNLIRMVKEGLAVELKNALAKARRDNEPVHREGVRPSSDRPAELNLHVFPFGGNLKQNRKYLVLFEHAPPRFEPPHPKAGRESARERALERENEHLRQELVSSREHLQSIIGDQEAAQEELRSVTEEIQSSNEELQSTNEELETSQEELQSTNEELNTVNEELQNRNTQLAQMANDLLNLLANVNMPILILDMDLKIRRFTPTAEKALNLIAADTGRPIRDINLRIRVPKLEQILRDVLTHLIPFSLEVSDPDGRRYSFRARPYRTEENQIEGVVMVFVDVDPGLSLTDDSAGGYGGRLHPFLADSHSEALASKHEESVRFSSALLHAQEDERRALSHRLHAELNQKLALLESGLEGIATGGMPVPQDTREKLKSIHDGVSEISEDLRRIAFELHPSILDDLGLVHAIESYCKEFSEHEGIEARFTHRNVPEKLPPTVSLALYRVMQESMRNVAKHSGAKRAAVNVTAVPGQIELVVRDGGVGFTVDPAIPGLGMLGMKERMSFVGGHVEWKTKPGNGTIVTARVPLPDGAHMLPSKP